MWAGAQKITSSRSLKSLGFTFGEDPTPNAHVSGLIKRFRSRTWAIRKLRRANFSTEELIKFYKSNIRSLAEYASPAFHSMIPAYLSEDMERQQNLALKNVFGVGISAERMREKAGITTLKERRETATLKFALKTEKSERFRDWFPRRQGPHISRKFRPILESTARTNRHRDSPINLSLIHI